MNGAILTIGIGGQWRSETYPSLHNPRIKLGGGTAGGALSRRPDRRGLPSVLLRCLSLAE